VSRGTLSEGRFISPANFLEELYTVELSKDPEVTAETMTVWEQIQKIDNTSTGGMRRKRTS